ncbi:MAG TPA: DUF4382 domain-containing protein [Fimbriimonas sp.]
MKKYLLACFAACMLALGCGGESGSGSGDTGGGSGAANVKLFITDAPVKDYQSVWVTIHKVELTGPNGTVAVYENAEGNVVDLAKLSKNNVPQFAFLGITNIPAGVYASARVTLDENVSLVPRGGGDAIDRVFADSQNGQKVVTFDLGNDRLANQDNLVIDFDLEKWTEDGQFVTAVVKKGLEDGLSDKTRHEHEEWEGTISHLTGESGAQSFEIRHGRWYVKVATTPETAIYNSDGSTSPTLSNGARVHVRGAFDVARDAVVADSIKVKMGGGDGHEDEDEAEGIVSEVGANSFKLQVTDTEGFVPEADVITVSTSETTRFFSRGGIPMTSEAFYAYLSQNAGPAASFVEAEGAYDAATNTLAAVKVKLEDADDDDGHIAESEVEGPVSEIDAAAHTFKLTVESWEGVSLEKGEVVTVEVDTDTMFRGDGHETLTMDQFFARLTAGVTVEVKGSLQGAKLDAVRVEFEDGDGHHGGDD